MAYVPLVSDVLARRILSWRPSASMRTDLAFGALEQAVYDRETDAGLVHHSGRGSLLRERATMRSMAMRHLQLSSYLPRMLREGTFPTQRAKAMIADAVVRRVSRIGRYS